MAMLLRGSGVKKSLLLVVLTAILFLGVCGTVFATSAQDIYRDFSDNGKLDGTYTDAELRAYLNNATLHQYPPDASKVQSLDALVRGLLAVRSRFPFTGAEIALAAVGAFALLGTGLGLRQLARRRR
jgi:hypothetical protein